MRQRVSKSRKRIRLLGISLALAFSCALSGALAATPQQLVNEYGKYRVIAILTELTNDYSFTIQTESERYVTNSPDPRYITAETLAIDMRRHGITSAQLEAALLAKREKEQAERQGRTRRPSVAPPPERPVEPEVVAPKEPNPACLVSRSQAGADRLEKVQAQYPGSTSMHQMLLDTNMEDYEYICSIGSDPKTDPILSELFDKYYPNYTLIRMLFEKELEAKSGQKK